MKKFWEIIELIIKLLPPIWLVDAIAGSWCWINDGFYTGRTIWQMLIGRYPYGFWGTLVFLFFTFGTFIAISCTQSMIWASLSKKMKNIIGLEFLANLLYITYHLPMDIWFAPSVELAHWYSIIDVVLITYCLLYIKRGCYDPQ